MEVNIKSVEIGSFSFEFEAEEPEREQLSIPIFDSIQFFCKGILTKSSEEQFLLKGEYKARFTTSCQSCLSNFLYNAEQKIELSLFPEYIFNSKKMGIENLSSDYYSGDKIILDKYFQTQFLLDIPFTTKCQENCKGICIQCGINLNQKSCDCKPDFKNPFAQYFQK